MKPGSPLSRGWRGTTTCAPGDSIILGRRLSESVGATRWHLGVMVREGAPSTTSVLASREAAGGQHCSGFGVLLEKCNGYRMALELREEAHPGLPGFWRGRGATRPCRVRSHAVIVKARCPDGLNAEKTRQTREDHLVRKLLYSNGSPYARRVRVVMIEKGLGFDSDVNDALRPISEIQSHNPALQVPVLYDGDRHLFGSNLILQYLYEQYPGSTPPESGPPLAPTITRPERHWDDMQILTAIESMADTLVGLRLLLVGGDVDVPYVRRQRVRIVSCLDWLEERITSVGFWPEFFSVMDINLMFPLLYGEMRSTFDYRTGQWPKIASMVDRWESRPSLLATPIDDRRGIKAAPPG